jgi:HSP20 family protein
LAGRNDPSVWMWTEACDLIDEAERLHRRFFQLGASRRDVPTWEPPVDVFEDDREILLVVAMPGVSADRIQVITEPGALVVRGVRPVPLSGSRHRVRQLEIPYGAFERRILLPPGPLEVGQPELSQGCLYLRLRRV